jgi:hypothetical protein
MAAALVDLCHVFFNSNEFVYVNRMMERFPGHFGVVISSRYHSQKEFSYA